MDNNELIRFLPEAQPLINAHPFKAQVLAAAVEIALSRRGDGLVTPEDVRIAIDRIDLEYGGGRRRPIRISGLCYAIGGAILGVALGAIILGPSPIVVTANLPLLLIAIGAVLILILGFVDENM